MRNLMLIQLALISNPNSEINLSKGFSFFLDNLGRSLNFFQVSLKQKNLDRKYFFAYHWKPKQKLKKWESSWFDANYFLCSYFPGGLSIAALGNRGQWLNVITVIKNVNNEYDRRRKSYRSCFTNWYRFCQISLCWYVLLWTSQSYNSSNSRTVHEICSKYSK